MRIRWSALGAASTVVGIALTGATATAAPADIPAVSYRAQLATDQSVVTVLENGTFALSDDGSAVSVFDTAGRALDSLPLRVRIDNQTLPVRHQIASDGRTLTLTPDVAAIRREELKPVASPVENQLAMNDLINAVSIGTSVGSLIGTAVGAVLGVGVGVALAGASCVVLSLGCVVAVLPIVALAGGVGGMAGLVLGGGPTAGIAVYQYLTTLNAPPGTSKYAPDLQARPESPSATPGATQ
ncbi:hypothetical protein [Nocardia lijiangensis]|uniref:hypothetical protein n=1 Tax=Nocardia lijiangensis TaxID=299618 RepID=UPI00082B3D68|nr:hypothetical protein [Nocardia lijiangensis]